MNSPPPAGGPSLSSEQLQKNFERAAANVWEYNQRKQFQDAKWRLYGLFKVVKEGKCDVPKPQLVMGVDSGWKLTKWENWMHASTFSKDEAMTRYIKLALEVLREVQEEEGRGAEQQRSRNKSDVDARAQLEAVMEHNKELERLLEEMQARGTPSAAPTVDASGAQLAGWLHKWVDRDAYMWGSAKWEPMYFVLKGHLLAMYGSEHEPSARSVVSLRGCVLKDEGCKTAPRRSSAAQAPSYHIFGIYLAGHAQDFRRGPDSGVLMRLSTQDEDRAQSWMKALALASVLEDADLLGGQGELADRQASDVADQSGAPAEPRLQRVPSQLEIKRRISLKQLAEAQAEPPERRKFDPRSYPASKPMHKEVQSSLLSADNLNQNYRGIMNLGAIILVVTHARLIWQNLLKYGVLISPLAPSNPSGFRDWPCLTGTLALALHVLAALAIEAALAPQAGAKGAKPWESFRGAWGIWLHGLNLLLELGVPVYVVWHYTGTPLFGFGYLFTAVILWMKLFSYAHANRDLRLAWCQDALDAKMRGNGPAESSGSRGGSAPGGVQGGWVTGGAEQPPPRPLDPPGLVAGPRLVEPYPSNLTVANIMYFWFAPTLCYQLSYPRTGRVNWRRAVTLVAGMAVFSALIVILVEQYVVPTVKDSYHTLEALNLVDLLERLLALAIPVTYVWLLGFYVFFHLFMGFLAEVLRFGDRVFYRDWWNATTIEAYWRMWNLPVHYWMVRHIYFPCLRLGISKTVASTICFLFSAVFHELLISVPFRMIKWYAFFGMLANIPLVPLTKLADQMGGPGNQMGNYIFWIVFCIVGQPVSVVMYYYDFCTEHKCEGLLLE